jgi:hypothetical protein
MNKLSDEEIIMAFMKEFKTELHKPRKKWVTNCLSHKETPIFKLYSELGLRNLRKEFAKIYTILYGKWDKAANELYFQLYIIDDSCTNVLTMINYPYGNN